MSLTRSVIQGEICDIDGKCVDAAEDELFKLTTKDGKISVEREVLLPSNLMCCTVRSAARVRCMAAMSHGGQVQADHRGRQELRQT